jgi:hypothetical protein
MVEAEVVLDAEDSADEVVDAAADVVAVVEAPEVALPDPTKAALHPPKTRSKNIRLRGTHRPSSENYLSKTYKKKFSPFS